MKKVLLFLLLCLPVLLQAQTHQVPDEITFGGIRVKLTPKAREIVQKDLDRLLKYQSYFDKKVEKARAHMPVIERVMREEGLPTDFRFLVIQESDLEGDAVSSSNAVGYWQFKKPTGIEMGLRIDNQIDERMNLVSATRAACTYLKKSNYYFDNWVYALLSYHEGITGAKPQTQKGNYGAGKMEVDHKMHWYVLRNFAYKLAFEQPLSQQIQGKMTFVEYTQSANKSLKDIARETSVPIEDLQAYNKWLLKGTIPADKVYTVLLPVYSSGQLPSTAGVGGTGGDQPVATATGRPVLSANSRYTSLKEALRYPIISQRSDRNKTNYITRVNGREGTVAKSGDDRESLARQGGISVEDFLEYNDLGRRDAIKAGQPYYFQKKRNKAGIYYHAAQPGETMWSISQRFGVKLKKLYKKNRMQPGTQPKPGRVLWLRHIRPARVPVEYRQVPAPVQAPDTRPEQTHPVREEPAVVDVPPTEEEQQPEETKEPEVQPSENTIRPTDGPITVTVSTGDKPATSEEEAAPEGIEEEPVETVTEQEPVVGEPEPKTEPADSPDNTTVHIVGQGQTLFAISRIYAVKVEEIVSLNALTSNDLSIGQRLLIPVEKIEEEPPAKPVIVERKHVVTQGQTLFAISRIYKVKVEDIMDWNAMTSTSLQPGQVLIIRVQE